MKFLITIFALAMSLALVAGQQFGFGRVQRQFNYNSLDFGQASAGNVRDPRQNRGPVVFPPSPPDAIEESSGVIVGASGYGFVPPQQSQSYFGNSALQLPPASSYTAFNYYNSPYSHRFSFF